MVSSFSPSKAAPAPPAAGADVMRHARVPLRRRALAWELGVLATLYAVYTGSRDAVSSTRSAAVAHGAALLHLERVLHLDPEHWANRALATHPLFAQLADYDYAAAHFAITIAVMVWLYRRHGRAARPLVAVWFVTNVAALIVFFAFPTAPPRLLPHAGFIDTVVVFHTWGSWGTGAVASASNQYAAMPSLHVAWALWSMLAIWSLTRRVGVRLLAAAYPVITVLVVIATANHYLLDTVAGGIAVAVACAVVASTVRLAPRVSTARRRVT